MTPALPRVGAKIRVTRTHVSGASVVTEGVVATVPLVGGPVTVIFEGGWQAVIEGAFDDQTVTWEELEPPVPVPPIPEPGYYLGANGCCVAIDENGYVAEPGAEVGYGWKDGHRLGPFTRLLPATDVVPVEITRELAKETGLLLAAVTDGHMPLPSTVYTARAALARVEAALGGGQ